MNEKSDAPRTFEDLAAQLAQRHGQLSDRLRQIAEFAVLRPNDMALGTVSSLAQAIGVQPSAMVRFANSLGYDGFSEMQQVFRARLVDAASPSYRDRIATMRRSRSGDRRVGEPADVLAEFVADDITSLEALYNGLPAAKLSSAVRLLAEADTIFILAQGRSFPIAYYLDYGLCRLDLRSHLLDGVGGLVHQRARVITNRDLLLVVSFKDYAPETLRVASDAAGRGVPVVVITDVPLSPYAAFATVSLEVGEASNKPFRTLVAPICLSQSLVVAVGHHLAERNGALS
jgi:DNA-binding MurR/RpiR family transcriptional regulator